MDESRYGLLRYHARRRYNAVRDAGKIGDGFASKPSRQLETTSDHFEYLSIRSVQEERDMQSRICLERSESEEKRKFQAACWTWLNVCYLSVRLKVLVKLRS